MQGTVRALFLQPDKKVKPIPVKSVETAGQGFGGDYHSTRENGRQVLIIAGGVLDDLGLESGAVFENVVIDGLDVMSFAQGQQLRVGDALLEVTIPCEPCVMMDRIRHGLQHALKGRRGMFAKVVAKGAIHVGDSVTVVAANSE